MMSRRGWVRSALPLILIGVAVLGAACGGGDAVDPAGPAPPPPPPPPANRAPVAGEAIPDRTVVEGQTVTIDVSASFSDPDGDALTYVATTSNPAVATIGLSGTELSVTGGARGAAAVTVRVSDPGGLSATQSFAVEVAEPVPTTVTVAPDTATLTAIDQTTPLFAGVRDQIGRPMTDATVAWSSGDTAVATVDTTGLVTAVANGSATIAAHSGEVSGSASIEVSQTPATVEIAPATRTLAAGDTVRLVATATDGNGHVVEAAAFGWTSSDTAVASVDSLGLVTGVAEGTATITAAGGDAAAGVEGTAEITVLPPPPANRAPVAGEAIPDRTVVEGQTVTIDLSASFSDPDGDALTHAATTSNAEVATVALLGTELSVTGVARGAAAVTVTASDPGGLSASQSFAVEVAAAAPATVTVTPATHTLAAGGTVRLVAMATDGNGHVVEAAAFGWTSSDTAVASVDSLGLVTGVAEGTATITAAGRDAAAGVEGTAEITVLPPPPANRAPVAGEAIPDRTVVEGQTVTIDLSASFSDPDGDALTYVATTSNPAVATVGLSGTELTVTGGAAGAATVTVRVSDPGGLSAAQSFAVEVAEPAPTTVTVTPDTATLTALGQTVRLSADVRDQIGRPMTDATVAWSSGDTAVASVDSLGLVTGVAEGTATITAAGGDAAGGVEGTAEITVPQPPPAPVRG
ncbi:Ig-like domain-containing protein [Candidatus Palauibacter sp.]|uniref:Ig-like domain-containing protein n=1 Tax=Candidatus Palauibacter sp. TaxID=3101350 RepID=UPI003B0265DF